MARELDNQVFQKEILDDKKTALIDFTAPWCGPCRMMAPIIENLAAKYDGKLLVAKVNVDNTPDLAAKYNVASIPTLIFFKNGEPVHTTLGAMPEPEVDSLINSHLL
jgi:thioredoxin 1